MARGIRRLGRGAGAAASGRARTRSRCGACSTRSRGRCGARPLTHSSWVEHRADSYGRLAFLGDSVLGLAVAEHLSAAIPRADIGRLTKIHGQAVSGRACAEVAERARPAGAARARPRPAEVDGGIDVEALLASASARSPRSARR